MKKLFLLFLLLANITYGQIQTINRGASPGDGTGDGFRTAMGKVNANFTYAMEQIALKANIGEVINFSDDFEGDGTIGDPVSLNLDVFDLVDPTNPLVAPSLVDDFFSVSVETGETGALGWSFNNGSIAVHLSEQNHPGSFTRTTGATTDQISTLYLGAQINGTANAFRFDEFDEITWIIKLSQTSADFRIRCGIAAFSNDENLTHGVFFERMQTDTEWFGATENGSSGSRTASLIANSTNWIKLKLRRINATTVGFSVNGGTEVTKTTDIPDAADTMMPHITIIPSTANAKSVVIDFFSMKLLPVVR